MSNCDVSKGSLAPVSVVVPYYRSADVIRRALDSVRSQTLQPLEVIVVDDCSNDGMLPLLQSLVGEFGEERSKLIVLPANGGPGAARNAGWDAARGEYVAFLDADDAWHPEKLEVQYSWMKQHPLFDLTGHPCKLVADGYAPEPLTNEVQFKKVHPRQLLAKNFFSTQTVMIKRNVTFRFQADKRYSEDYLLACQVCCSGFECAAAPLPLAYLFKASYGAGGLSGDLWKMGKGELEVYRLLYSDSKINLADCVGFSLFSFVKLIRRYAVVCVRRLVS